MTKYTMTIRSEGNETVSREFDLMELGSLQDLIDNAESRYNDQLSRSDQLALTKMFALLEEALQ